MGITNEDEARDGITRIMNMEHALCVPKPISHARRSKFSILQLRNIIPNGNGITRSKVLKAVKKFISVCGL